MFHFEQEEGFTIINNISTPDWGKSLRLKTNLKAFLDFLYRKNIKNVEINDCEGAIIPDLEFLRNNLYIEGVTIVSPRKDDIDISAINTCNNLKRIGIRFKHKQEVDFSNFPHLTDANIYWSSNIKSLEDCKKMRIIMIENYTARNLTLFEKWLNLNEIYLHNTLIQDLKGIENSVRIDKIIIDGAKKLESLQGITVNHQSLSDLRVYSAKHLIDILNIKYASNLEFVDFWKIGELTNESYNLWHYFPSIRHFRVVNKSGVFIEKLPKP
ncbi:hypothetical protein QNI19_34940 [Cytophagaceae bacterium DM2B3-1]|uniref:F-box associated domain-containing protein n=1 Tax=Xanthocytophaga flava TaxID=3048013 RepID=A0ABT7CWT0_9BACT|nr:hypothetical protein [Xanthocytophaga flavus]MDJ1498192.1 hypothetical protein [Xanthocytophaga flavus]